MSKKKNVNPQIFCSHTGTANPRELIQHPDNPNRHPPEQLKMLQHVIKENGWRYPIVVSKRSGYVIKGHGRIEAAIMAGWTSVPVDEQDYATEADEFADMVADNKLPEMSSLDIGAINPMLSYFVDNDFDVTRLGFTEIETKSILDGWLPDKVALDNKEETDEPMLSKITVECYEMDEKTIQQKIRDFISTLDIKGVIVK